MKISDELFRNIWNLTERVVIDAINTLYDYQKKYSYIPTYYRFPKIFPQIALDAIKESKNFDELKEVNFALNYNIPFYTFVHYGTPKKYSELLNGKDGEFYINCHKLEGFDELMSVFNENQVACEMLTSYMQYLESYIIFYIGNIVNRYLYETKRFERGDINYELIKLLIEKQLIRLFSERLDVNICIPICLLEFEENKIEITDTIEICKMSQEFQISRFNASNFESTQENNLIQCANYMIRMKNYDIENRDSDSLLNAIKNYWAYPIEIVDDLFAAIRIVVGFKTGYGQLLIEPEQWADEWTADLIPIYGTTIRAFNRKELEVQAFRYEIGLVHNSDIDLIREVFNIIRHKRANEKKNGSFKKVLIAIQRLNRCLLREEDDDTALDAIIGIETLLSGDTHGEITYTISNRLSVVAAKLKECPYSPIDARKAMKTIYGFRSDIVHGREMKKNSKVKIDNKELETKELSIEFLRFSLLFIIKNQEFLDEKQFEVALDEAISGKE